MTTPDMPRLRLRKGQYSFTVDAGPGRRRRTILLGTDDIEVARSAIRAHGLTRLAQADDLHRAQQTIQGTILPAPADHGIALFQWEQNLTVTKARRTVDSYMNTMQGFVEQFELGLQPLTAATAGMVDAYVNLEGKYGSRRVKLVAIREFYAHCRNQGAIKINPAGDVIVRHQDMEMKDLETFVSATMTEPEYRLFLKTTTQSLFWRAAATLGWWLGLRLSDCIMLQYASIEQPDHIIIWTQKRRRRLVLPLDDPLIGGGELRLLIQEILEKPRGASVYCFPRQAEIYRADQWVLSEDFRQRMKKLGSRCTHKSLRKAAAQRWRDGGKSLEDIAVLIGHAKTATTKIYLQP